MAAFIWQARVWQAVAGGINRAAGVSAAHTHKSIAVTAALAAVKNIAAAGRQAPANIASCATAGGAARRTSLYKAAARRSNDHR